MFVDLNSSIKKVAETIERPCSYSYLQPEIDALKFCPYSLQSQRSIDIGSIGHRPASIHASLLKKADKNNFFYMYDTMR